MDNPSSSSSVPGTNRIAFKLNRDAERSLKQGHPWIFENSIIKQNREGAAGDLAIIFENRSNAVLGIGLYDPHSPIRIKILHNKGSVTIDTLFFRNKIEQAFNERRSLLRTETNSYRLIFGENDGMPGLIADVYSEAIVVKLYSSIWLPYLEYIRMILCDLMSPAAMVLRLSRNVQKLKLDGWTDGKIIYGELNDPRIVFKEYGVNFSADLIKGHKTGYFLDHRQNRREVGLLAADKTVLDVFSYAGGFSVHALVGGAKSVTSVDISEPALEMAGFNASLNIFEGKHNLVCGDAFDVMKKLNEEGLTFDIVVVDPPSFAKSKKEISKAKRKYSELAVLGAGLVDREGLLVLASCSSRIDKETFLSINSSVLNSLNRGYRLIKTTDHDIDHPIGFLEGAYLKCAYYRFYK